MSHWLAGIEGVQVVGGAACDCVLLSSRFLRRFAGAWTFCSVCMGSLGSHSSFISPPAPPSSWETLLSGTRLKRYYEGVIG